MSNKKGGINIIKLQKIAEKQFNIENAHKLKKKVLCKLIEIKLQDIKNTPDTENITIALDDNIKKTIIDDIELNTTLLSLDDLKELINEK